MKPLFKNPLVYVSIFLALLFSWEAFHLASGAWIPPTGTPLTNQPYEPIDVGTSTQDKPGILGVGSLGLIGQIFKSGDELHNFIKLNDTVNGLWIKNPNPLLIETQGVQFPQIDSVSCNQAGLLGYSAKDTTLDICDGSGTWKPLGGNQTTAINCTNGTCSSNSLWSCVNSSESYCDQFGCKELVAPCSTSEACDVRGERCAPKTCGNGTVNSGEECDLGVSNGNNIGQDSISGKTCMTQGYNLGGKISCDAGCGFNASKCVRSFDLCTNPSECGSGQCLEGRCRLTTCSADDGVLGGTDNPKYNSCVAAVRNGERCGTNNEYDECVPGYPCQKDGNQMVCKMPQNIDQCPGSSPCTSNGCDGNRKYTCVNNCKSYGENCADINKFCAVNIGIVSCVNPFENSKIIFLTSIAYPGNIGGVNGADEKCQSLANSSTKIQFIRNNAKPTFKAWISDSVNNASARLSHSEVPYKLLNTNTISSNWDNLLSSSPKININEKGESKDNVNVWTGTKPDGTYFNNSSSNNECDGWTSSSDNNKYGIVGSNYSSNWTFINNTVNDGARKCSQSHHLYCIEQ